MSFIELLPSSLLVALVIGLSLTAAGLIFSQSEAEDGHLPTVVVGVVVLSVVVGVFLAFLVSFFPQLITFQWHLLKRL